MSTQEKIDTLIAEYQILPNEIQFCVSPTDATKAYHLGYNSFMAAIEAGIPINDESCPFTTDSDIDGILQEQWLDGFELAMGRYSGYLC